MIAFGFYDWSFFEGGGGHMVRGGVIRVNLCLIVRKDIP